MSIISLTSLTRDIEQANSTMRPKMNFFIVDIEAMSYRELQKACKVAGLPAKGTTQNLKDRLRENALVPGTTKETKKSVEPKKKVEPSRLIHEFVCSISLQLPLNPAVAEDGKIYEYELIDRWLKKHNTSPTTNARMGKNLVKSTSIRNTIENLVKGFQASSGTEEDKALVDDWNLRYKHQQDQIISEQNMKSLIAKAKSGDADAMEQVGRNYRLGRHGFKKDTKKGNRWTIAAANAGSLREMAKAGEYLFSLTEASRTDRLKGLSYLSQAAHVGGCDRACIYLGMCYADGKYGLKKSKPQAVRLLQIGLSGQCKDSHYASQGQKERAQKRLAELLAE